MRKPERAIGKPKKDNYPYATARVKARKSTLIPKSQYNKYMVMRLPEIIRHISETVYAKEISELSTKYTGLDLVEAATFENLANNYTEVLDFCGGQLRKDLQTYLKKWDIWNIKTIVRGKSYGAEPDEIIEDLVPAGAFTKEFLIELARAEDFDTVIEALKPTEYHKYLMDARLSSGAFDQMKFENDMDRDYLQSLLTIKAESRWLSRILERFFRSEIDIANLKVMFRLKYSELDCDYIMNFITPGGYELDEATLKRLAMTEDFDKFLDELKAFKFWAHIKEPAETARETGTLNPVMSALEIYHHRRAIQFGRLYPLSILPFLAYFIWKKVEVDNIRIICRGKEAGLSDELIKSMMIT
jgi:V/A-type H+-transporting ATPase subunit C